MASDRIPGRYLVIAQGMRQARRRRAGAVEIASVAGAGPGRAMRIYYGIVRFRAGFRPHLLLVAALIRSGIAPAIHRGRRTFHGDPNSRWTVIGAITGLTNAGNEQRVRTYSVSISANVNGIKK